MYVWLVQKNRLGGYLAKADQFKCYLFENPEDGFSRDMAQSNNVASD